MELNEKIKDTGLFFPIDPGPSVSIIVEIRLLEQHI
jgi:mevalonate pyrophosphate decarboxylase